jgi:predicted dehydrogenase
MLEAAEPLRHQCQQFLKSMATRERALTDGESGLRVLRVLDAAERSLASGGAPVEMIARKEISD